MVGYPCSRISKVAVLLTRQEPQKTKPKKLSLADWMCYEAELVVQENFTDVAVWDRKLVNRTNPHETRLWWIHAFGSQFLPLYCRISQKIKTDGGLHELSAVEINLLRLFREDSLSKIQNKIILSTSKFFFITKGCNEFDYCVKPAKFREVANLVFVGKADLYLEENETEI